MISKNIETSQKISPNQSQILPLEFQIIDWNSYHEIDHTDEEKYVIQLFGRTADDKDVCLKVTDFTPYFYVEVPTNWTKTHIDKFVYILKSNVSWRTTNNPTYNYDLSKSLTKYAMLNNKYNFYNFTNKRASKFVWLLFKSHTAMREFSSVLCKPLKAPGLTAKPKLYQRFEANIEPHIRFMHAAKISSCGWVSVDAAHLTAIPEYSSCDHSFEVNWKNVKPAKNDDRMAPLKIMGYDIECISCDINFPQAERKSDKIIQIGMTMYRYGSMECYESHMLALKHCAPIEGANVECYKTEKGLIRGWAKKLRELRPDIRASYNGFGFDDSYIFDRIARIDRETADRQGISVDILETKFMDEILQIIGKVSNKYLVDTEQIEKTMRPMGKNDRSTYGPSLSYFQVKELSSSALGDNQLSFFQTPGTLSIDVMKVIQRDHRLVGYKLDNVSANFITEVTDKIVEETVRPDGKIPIKIYTRSTKALEKNSYIQLMVNDGHAVSPLNDNAKYPVLDIETVTEKIFDAKEQKEKQFTCQCIKTVIDAKELVNLREVLADQKLEKFWTFAKDDMHHTFINKYFNEGRPKKIAQVGKYCLKDCKLVNLLLAKLEIIVNSVGMAKVCHVPLSYLFLRGQGVKIFSLVSKKCREENYLIPTLRSSKLDNNGDDDETYEGATVITPRPGVYLSPIGVLDYSSLYPNSMRECNLSHESYVADPAYDNLPGYVYHDIVTELKDKKGKVIRNIDGTAKVERHRFSQKIITDQEINIEMADVIARINHSMTELVEKIRGQKYLTHAQRKQRIDAAKLTCDQTVKSINNNENLTLTEKTAQTVAAQRVLERDVGAYMLIESQIAAINEKFAVKISKTPDLETISKLNTKLSQAIDDVASTVKIIKQERAKMIEQAEAMARQQIAAEKAKKYNVVNGQTVKYGILPEILTELLNKRKETNARLASEKDPFIKAILNALQLAFKVTANSLYGQTGAPTSPIFFRAIAASTTAIGRLRLHFAKKLVEDNFTGAEVIYGDTDSIFINFHVRDENGVERTDREALVQTIELCKQAAKIINTSVPSPQSIVYEKTFHPFILVAKKKYVGLLFETDPNKYKLKSMGIVLKRRDNAPIAKIVIGGIIDYILKNRDIDKAVEYTRQVLCKLMAGKYPIDKFIISKTLKSRYKKPSTIAHKVLADRMAVRDPGNRPQINDRIPFVYVVTDVGKKKKKDILQGDLIEHPDYVVSNKLQIDYLYYLEHQIINPATQILELMMPTRQVEKFFNKFIVEEENKRKGRQSMERWMDFTHIKNYQPESHEKIKSFNQAAPVKNNNKLANLPYIGNTRRLERKNMNIWLQSGAQVNNNDEWQPICDIDADENADTESSEPQASGDQDADTSVESESEQF